LLTLALLDVVEEPGFRQRQFLTEETLKLLPVYVALVAARAEPVVPSTRDVLENHFEHLEVATYTLSARPKVFWYNISLYSSATIRYVKPISRAMSVRYVCPLTEQQRALLESTMKNDASHRARMRAHGLLLSSEGITIKAIAKIYHVDRDTVSTWIKKWEKHADKRLHDQPRSGSPTILNTTEKELAKQYIKEEPRSLKNVAERLAHKTAKHLSMSSLKRLAKKARLRWKRVRKSLKSLRDPRAFAQCKRALEALQKQEDQGKIDLYYFDEAGFTLDPYIPYAWQEPGTVIEIPAQKYGRLNVLGFMHRKNDWHPFIFEQSVHTGVVIACFEEFSKTLKKNGCCHG
jgi:transposase